MARKTRRSTDGEAQAGQAIRQARLDRGWTQERLAEELQAELDRLEISETVSQGAISNWERGIARPEPSKIGPVERILPTLQRGLLGSLLYSTSDTTTGDGTDGSNRRQIGPEDRLTQVERELRDIRRLLETLVGRDEALSRRSGKNRGNGR